jgi:hypothetical protein
MQGGGVNREAAIISERPLKFAFADLIPSREVYILPMLKRRASQKLLSA